MNGGDSGAYRATYCQSMIARFLSQNQNSSYYFFLKRTVGDRRIAGKHIDAMMFLFTRHKALQTTYHITDNSVYCRPSLSLSRKGYCREVDAAGWQNSQISNYLQTFYHRTSLNIDKGPITRIFIFYTSPHEFVLAVSSQHIAFDAYSLILLNKELDDLLSVDAKDYKSMVAELKYDFSIYAKWEQALCDSSEGTRRANYWRKLLSTYKPIDLPVDYRDKDEEAPGLRPLHVLNQQQTSQLKSVAEHYKSSINLLMFCVYTIAVALFSKKRNIAVVTPYSNRHVKTRFIRVVGNFLDYLPIFTKIDSNRSIKQSIQATLEAITQARNNYLPLGKIMELRGKTDDDNPTQLLKCYVNCIPNNDSIPPPLLALPEESELLVGAGKSPEQQELALFFSEYDEQLRWRFSERADLFTTTSMQSIESLVCKVIAALLSDDNSSKIIGDIKSTYSPQLLNVKVRNDC